MFSENKYVPRGPSCTVSNGDKAPNRYVPVNYGTGPIPGGELNGTVKGGSNAPLNVPPLVGRK